MDKWIENKFVTFDGLKLFYRCKLSAVKPTKCVLILHRGHEHSGRIVGFSEQIDDGETSFFAFDMRGHGRSEGKIAYADNFDVWVRDLDRFAHYIRTTYGIPFEKMVLIANSVAAVMATRWILNYGPNVRGCVLAAPAFSIKLYIPLALQSLRILKLFTKNAFVTSYVKSKLLTRNAVEASSYDRDPLITKKIGVNVLVSLFDCAKNVLRRAEDFETPCLIFTAEHDYIVKNAYHGKFFAAISSKVKRHIVLPKFRHAVLHENNLSLVVDPIKDFMADLFRLPTTNLPMRVPQAREHTVKEYNELKYAGSKLKKAYYYFFRLGLLNIGKFSKGVELGIENGFNSGPSLDYIYQNKASGSNLIGRLIDRIYLNSVGWRGIRIRKKHLRDKLIEVATKLSEQNKDVVALDIASGPGRYLFEAAEKSKGAIALHLNDADLGSLREANELAKRYRYEGASFSNEDIFKFDVSKVTTTPNVIVASGVFELYSNNEQVKDSLQKMHDLIEDDGYLIYTGQPWHPQLEMIGRVLNNFHGKRWIMRRRIQNEMDEIVESAGFTKIETQADDLGIFTVSCAQKKKITSQMPERNHFEH